MKKNIENTEAQLLRAKSVRLKREGRMAILFLIPSLLGLFFLNMLPMVIALFTSLTDWTYTDGIGNWNFVGLQNFVELFKDATFIKALKNTLYFTIVTVPVGIFLRWLLRH